MKQATQVAAHDPIKADQLWKESLSCSSSALSLTHQMEIPSMHLTRGQLSTLEPPKNDKEWREDLPAQSSSRFMAIREVTIHLVVLGSFLES